jgi:hypothetical protein
MAIMEKTIRNVRDIHTEDRHALERLIGKSLAEDEQVIISVARLNAASPDKPFASASQQVPEWWKVYEGLSDEEVDRLDQAIRQRANLTRVFE